MIFIYFELQIYFIKTRCFYKYLKKMDFFTSQKSTSSTTSVFENIMNMIYSSNSNPDTSNVNSVTSNVNNVISNVNPVTSNVNNVISNITKKRKNEFDDEEENDEDYDDDSDDDYHDYEINLKVQKLFNPVEFHKHFLTSNIQSMYYMSYEFDNEQCTYEIDIEQKYESDKPMMFQYIYNDYKSNLQMPTPESLREMINYVIGYNLAKKNKYMFIPFYAYETINGLKIDGVIVIDIETMNLYLLSTQDIPILEIILVKVCEDLHIFDIDLNYVPQCEWRNKNVIPFTNVCDIFDIFDIY